MSVTHAVSGALMPIVGKLVNSLPRHRKPNAIFIKNKRFGDRQATVYSQKGRQGLLA